MEIHESLMSQAFSVRNPDPYLLSLKIMEDISKMSKVVEKKNEYETDGPHHRSTVIFESIELIDDFSNIVFKFELNGEDDVLHANVNGIFDTHIVDTGFFSEVFTDYYVKTLFPFLRKVSEDKIKVFGERLNKFLEN
ncbi:MAG TPA: hypothetical protein HA230_02140 [Candidatus Aenigmarchaeota archaeon]|nr:hypothetical protein [Candidatus Aenigmarchaeota archaeon]